MAMLLNLKNSSDKDFVKTWTTKYIQVEEAQVVVEEVAQVVVEAQEVEEVKLVIEETAIMEVTVLMWDQIEYRVQIKMEVMLKKNHLNFNKGHKTS